MAENARTVRRQVARQVESAFDRLRTVVRDDFSPGYFNRPEVLAAERGGLSVCDAVLGHVLHAGSTPGDQERALELLRRGERSLVPAEVESRCHDVHATVLAMLDRIGYPAVMVWGSVNATAPRSRGFRFIGEAQPEAAHHRPGHSWLVTPHWNVVDLSISRQQDVEDDYDSLKNRLPGLVLLSDRQVQREEKNLTQAQLAQAADLSRTSIAFIEGARQECGLETFVKVALALGTEPHQLLAEVWPTVEVDDAFAQKVLRKADR